MDDIDWDDLLESAETHKVAPQPEDNYLREHDYFTGDDGQPDDDVIGEAVETLRHYVQDMGNDPNDPDFEFKFRAFLHNDDYSYDTRMIDRLLEKVQHRKFGSKRKVGRVV